MTPKWAKPVSDEEIAQRQALFVRIMEKRKRRNIAPLTTSDLVHFGRRGIGPDDMTPFRIVDE
jgi:hypothetical protein